MNKEIEHDIASCGLEVDSNGNIVVPDYFERVKIDVGLSSNAPQAAVWLNNEPNLMVLGFEPVKGNRELISSGGSSFPNKIDARLVGKSLFILPFAIANVTGVLERVLHVTKMDPGCSSLLKPRSFELSHQERVKVIALKEILKRLPSERFGFIDHLKTDCQGMDLEVLKSCGSLIKRIAFITAEPENHQYESSRNSRLRILFFMLSKGFFPVRLYRVIFPKSVTVISVDDATFFNLSLLLEEAVHPRLIFQRG